MQKLFGNNVEAVLKFGESITGVLFDDDADCVYIQSNSSVIAIPKYNVKYYISDGVHNHVIGSNEPSVKLDVHVDDILCTQISVPKDLDISTCNDKVLETIWGDSNVQQALKGKVQKRLEYEVGSANIITINKALEHNNSFSMGASVANPSTFKTPYDIIANIKKEIGNET